MPERKKKFPLKIVLIIVAIVAVSFVIFLFVINKTQWGQRLNLGFFDKLKSLSFKNPFSKTGFAVSSIENISKTNPLRNFNPFDYINPFK